MVLIAEFGHVSSAAADTAPFNPAVYTPEVCVASKCRSATSLQFHLADPRSVVLKDQPSICISAAHKTTLRNL